MTVAVATEAKIKTEKMDLSENRGSPDRPCPQVQPPAQ